jgi:hypothetical protein
MQRQTVLAICLLTVLAFSWSAATAHASSVNYTIHDGKVSVELSLQAYQNATAIPTITEKLTGAAAQNLTSAIEKSIKSIAENSSISSLSGELRTGSDWINVSIRFDVNGVASQSGNLLNVNCSWVRFKVSDNLTFENVSYNRIGGTYIKPIFEKYVKFAEAPLNETIQTVTYLTGGADTEGSLAAESAGNLVLLDFGNILPPIANWNYTYDVTSSSTVWSYDLVPPQDLTMTVVPIYGAQFTAHAFYKYNATLSIAGLAQAQGDTIRIDVSSGPEPLLMFVMVLVTFVVAVGASWTYRSRRKQLPRKRK